MVVSLRWKMAFARVPLNSDQIENWEECIVQSDATRCNVQSTRATAYIHFLGTIYRPKYVSTKHSGDVCARIEEKKLITDAPQLQHFSEIRVQLFEIISLQRLLSVPR